MKKVRVTSGYIIFDGVRYDIGDEFEVSDVQSQRWEQLGVAKEIPQSLQVERSVVDLVDPNLNLDPEPEAEVRQDAPVMSVDDTPFEKPRKEKRGKRRG